MFKKLFAKLMGVETQEPSWVRNEMEEVAKQMAGKESNKDVPQMDPSEKVTDTNSLTPEQADELANALGDTRENAAAINKALEEKAPN